MGIWKCFNANFLNKQCWRGVMIWCCDSLLKVMGTVGTLLFIFGVTQIGGGLYFLLVLTGFSIASNIWTGAVTSVTGVFMMYYGYSHQAKRHGNTLFLLTLLSFLTNGINLLIILIGERSKFLTEEQRQYLEENPEQEFFFEIAIWSSTAVSSAAILLSFITTVSLFWLYMRGPRTKGKISFLDDLYHESQKGNRFFPPSRLAASSKEKIHVLPPLDDVLALPDPSATNVNSSWVYNSDDKESLGLYPIGLEVHPEVLETKGRTPTRHSSFAASRYARVHQRPKRAQSFATTRDPFSHHCSKSVLRPLPVPVPQLMNLSKAQKVHKSSSFAENAQEGATTLSRKYRACTQNRDLDFAVIEVGSLKSAHSSTSLANALIDLPTSSGKCNVSKNKAFSSNTVRLKMTEFSKENEFNLSVKKANYLLPKLHSGKGPAPLPPTNKALASSTCNEKEKVTQNTKPKDPTTNDKHTNSYRNFDELENISNISAENGLCKTDESVGYCSCSETFGEVDEIEANHSSTISYESHSGRKDNDYQAFELSSTTSSSSTIEEQEEEEKEEGREELVVEEEEQEEEEDDETLNSTVVKEKLQFENYLSHSSTLPKPPRISIKKSREIALKAAKEILARDSISEKHKLTQDETDSVRHPFNHSNNKDSRTLPTLSEESVSDTLQQSMNTKGILKNVVTKPSKYETVHRQVIEDSKALLDQLPTSEVQKNKIVLRVPSFKTTGCQTEAYRPVRRRASCLQSNSEVPSRYLPSKEITRMVYWKHSESHSNPNTSNTGSSSSSGYSSPEGGSKNVSPIHSGPPSPGSLHAIHKESKEIHSGPNVTIIEVNREDSQNHYRAPNPIRSDFEKTQARVQTVITDNVFPIPIYDRATLSDDVTLLTEAVNPVLIRMPEGQSRIPRIIEAIRKPTQEGERPSRLDTFTSHRQNYQNRVNSLSLPRISAPSIRARVYRSASRSPSPEGDSRSMNANNSTAAYLASLEILASHYRQQALANAKQLQIQQKILEQHNGENLYYKNTQNQRHQPLDRGIQNDVIHE